MVYRYLVKSLAWQQVVFDHSYQVNGSLARSSQGCDQLCSRLKCRLCQRRAIQGYQHAQRPLNVRMRTSRYWSMIAHDKHRYRGMPGNLLGDTAEHPALQSRMPMTAHDNQVN